MRRTVLAIAFSILPVMGLAQTDGGTKLQDFKQLCIAEKSTGFNWVNGDWKQVNFKLQKYIIRKVRKFNEDTASIENTLCNIHLQEKKELLSFLSYPVCAKLQVIGDDLQSNMLCWQDLPAFNEPDDIKVSCRGVYEHLNIAFRTNGFYHRSQFHINVTRKPENNRKDSLYVEVGKCASIAD